MRNRRASVGTARPEEPLLFPDREVLEALPVGVLLVSPGGLVLLANTAASRLMGQPAASLTGLSLSEALKGLVTENGTPVGVAGWSDGGSPSGQVAGLSRPGRLPSWIQARSSWLRGGSRLVILSEVSERRRLIQALELSEARLKEVHRIREEFLANLSFELRTPLAAIAGWVRLLRLPELPAGARERALDGAVRNARRLEELLDDLFDSPGPAVAGDLRLNRRLVAPALLAQSALESVKPFAAERRVALSARLVRSGEVLVDADRLRLALSMVMDAAIRLSPPGTTVRVSMRALPRRLILEVKSARNGIPPEVLPHVFGTERPAPGVRDRRNGLGLGRLGFVRDLLRLHGGKAELANLAPGKGARFRLTLPRAA